MITEQSEQKSESTLKSRRHAVIRTPTPSIYGENVTKIAKFLLQIVRLLKIPTYISLPKKSLIVKGMSKKFSKKTANHGISPDFPPGKGIGTTKNYLSFEWLPVRRAHCTKAGCRLFPQAFL